MIKKGDVEYMENFNTFYSYPMYGTPVYNYQPADMYMRDVNGTGSCPYMMKAVPAVNPPYMWGNCPCMMSGGQQYQDMRGTNNSNYYNQGVTSFVPGGGVASFPMRTVSIEDVVE